MGRIDLPDKVSENVCVTRGYLAELYDEIAERRAQEIRLVAEIEELEDHVGSLLADVARLQRARTELRLVA